MVACYLTAKSAFSFYVANNIFLSLINLSLFLPKKKKNQLITFNGKQCLYS